MVRYLFLKLAAELVCYIQQELFAEGAPIEVFLKMQIPNSLYFISKCQCMPF